jgi:hypothetical protein
MAIDPIHRSFFERFSELSPTERFDIELVCTGLNGNGLVANGTHTLIRNPAYTGTTYEFWGPATLAPNKLGIRQGDIISGLDDGGSGPNNGMTLTVRSVTDTVITVYETLTVGPEVYNFVLSRRMA